MTVVRWIVSVGIFFALLLLALQNADHVTVRFFHWESQPIPLVVLLLVAFAAGVIAGLLVGAVRAARLKRQLNRLRRDHAKAFTTIHPAPPADAG